MPDDGGHTFRELIGEQLPVGSMAAVWNARDRRYTMERCGAAGWPQGEDALKLARGEAFWLHVPWRGATNRVYEIEWAGAEPLDETTLIDIYSGWNMVAYPYPKGIKWLDTQLAEISPNGSMVFFWNTERQRYVMCRRRFGRWIGAADLEIGAHRGIFYKPGPMRRRPVRARGRGRNSGRRPRQPLFQWVEERP